MKHRVFIVDDDTNIRELIRKFLVKEGYDVLTFASSKDVIKNMHALQPDCLVLDIMMPGENGLDLCRNIRREFNTPIIFLSAKGEEIDRILGIELGGDDYLVKPFSPRELVVRIKALLRRSVIQNKSLKSHRVSIGNLFINKDARIFSIDDNDINLTNKEFELITYLVENAHKAMSREQIIDTIWGYDYIGEMRSVDDLVRRLRKKLKTGNANVTIETVWGYGYKLEKK
ncbi:response regulator transcription factor [Clostridium sp. 'deep sea']|uniref:response regulator transcription factor n=1 Tax=Clostridium sp. 'deep sea' TaxID=2779445 RepID=UPI00189662FA|nr:response regulator transcription factor [Clostridium sp. 'deep sea']QOR36561.1 response regulator transcription factor [Clostridium sp. 'deep sea']